jgi:Tfp pilus assembly protein PilF
MLRRGFVLVLALLGFAAAQVHPGQTGVVSVPPTIEIDVAASLPIATTSASDPQRNRVPAGAFVSVSDLAVPARARRELIKANQLFAKQKWMQARARLTKAISFYSSYAGAYNNLAIAYEHLGEVDQERQSLERAVALNDRFVLARLNLGRMDIEQGKLSEAETELNKAATQAPQDPRVLILLSYCQLAQKDFDDAIATSQQAHKLSAPHTLAHRVAARAFEQKRQFDRAAAELKLFLQEEPPGPSAEAARNELQIVEAAQRK